MSRVGDDVKSKIKSLVYELLGGEVAAVTVYGSRVAGYAKPGSDYDVLAVARRFKDPLRYFYVSEPVKSSVLVVREKELLDDARSSKLGEFVVGRLLNVHEIILDPDGILAKAEAMYRRRVVEEELQELVFEYGQFSTQILIPPEYFLFSKLKKRAMVYPPAYYSYYHTYSGPRGNENTVWSVRRFKAVLDEMVGEGKLGVADGRYYLAPGYFKELTSKFRHPLLSTLGKAVKQYLAHFSSGKVGPRVFFEELSSKISRSREARLKLDLLENPRSLLSIPEGVFSTSGLEPMLKGSCSYELIPLGDVYSTAKLLRVRCGGGVKEYIAKEYLSPWALKWLVARIASAGVREFLVSPIDRLATEYKFSRLLRATGFRTPTILLVDPSRAILVREFVAGDTLGSILDKPDKRGVFEGLGRLLATLHNRYLITLGDVKPSNFLVSSDGLYIIDCEQARFGGDPWWDVAFIIYFSMLEGRSKNLENVKLNLEGFLLGYKSFPGRTRINKQLLLKIDSVFRPLLQPREIKLANTLLAELAAS
jgi:tRNA A-37 threonylcarbamoyl transferase component Bud32/predicted nucleotidyltransferase